MIQDAGALELGRRSAALDISQQHRGSAVQLVLQLLVQLLVDAAAHLPEALPRSQELLGQLVVVAGIVPGGAVERRHLSVWRERLNLQDMLLRLLRPYLQNGRLLMCYVWQAL